MKRSLITLTLLAAVLAVGACSGRDLSPLNPCTINAVDVEISVNRLDKIDLLLVIDDSNSMNEEQEKLRAQIPNLVSILASGNPPPDSGIPSFPAVTDLRVGIVGTNMGIGTNHMSSAVTASCMPVDRGDDGLLQRGTVIPSGMPPYLAFRAGDSTSGFATDVGSVADLGVDGCGYEQQLEAALKAITPSDSGINFPVTNGHGGAMDANQGFVRDDSLLAIIFLTDEDDCSASDFRVFHPNLARQDVQNLNHRCWLLGNNNPTPDEFLYNERRYIDGLRANRPPAQLVVAAITGIPEMYNTRVEGNNFIPTNFQALLADASMTEVAQGSSIAPVCGTPPPGGDGVAYPAIRISRTLEGLQREGVGVAIQSICQNDFSNALSVIINRIANALNATCLPRPLNRDSDGRVGCEIVEYLPPGDDYPNGCADLANVGRVAVGTVDHDNNPNTPDRQGCRICQVDASGNLIDPDPACAELGTNAGWFYEEGAALADRCPEGRRQAVSFSSGAEPVNRADIQFTCLQTANAGSGTVTVGTGCGSDPAICGNNPTIRGAPLPEPTDTLTCDQNGTSTCQFECGNDSDCERVGLGGYRCHDPDGEGPGIRHCVNPTCSG